MSNDEREEHRTLYVSVYRTDQQYGGPEEGGWYYTTYELVGATPFTGTAVIRKRQMDDTEMYGGGYDREMISEEEDGYYLTVGQVKGFDDPVAAGNEMERLEKMFVDSKGRLRGYSIVQEVYMGELTRCCGRRYC